MKSKKTKRIILISVLILLLVIPIILLIQRKTNKLSQVNNHFAKASVYTQIGEQEFDITNLIEQNPVPTISAGMIPIKWNDGYWEITTKDSWCDYSNGQPAFMMLNDGVYQSEEYYQMPKDKKLAEENIGVQISPDDTDTLGSIYMWIPRFAYNEEGEIIYIKEECVVSGSFTMPDCFTYEKDGKYFSLSGIWLEINEQADVEKTTTKVTSLNQGENDTTYGFLANTRANAMTADEQNAVQIYITNSMQNVGVGDLDDPFENTNHTILKIIDLNKQNPITATLTCDANTGIATINIVYSKNGISRIIDEEGNELETETIDNIVVATSQPQSNGLRNFYIIDNNGNIKEISTYITGELITAESSFNLDKLKITINVVSNRFDIAKIVYTKKNNDAKNVVLSEHSNTGILDRVTNGTYEFEVIDTKGNIITLTQEVTGVTGYIIETYDDLKEFRDDVNNGRTDYNTKAYQVADIEITDSDWTPIGNNLSTGTTDTKNKRFGGMYDGQGHIITINASSTENEYQGVFGCIYGNSSSKPAIIKNLGIRGTIDGIKYVGGIAGYSSNATISNCYNACNVTTLQYAGGITGSIGANVSITNCYNLGQITISDTSKSTIIGGICGYGTSSSATIKNCYNIGNIGIINNGKYVAGICGLGYTDPPMSISYCYNGGQIGSYRD